MERGGEPQPRGAVERVPEQPGDAVEPVRDGPWRDPEPARRRAEVLALLEVRPQRRHEGAPARRALERPELVVERGPEEPGIGEERALEEEVVGIEHDGTGTASPATRRVGSGSPEREGERGGGSSRGEPEAGEALGDARADRVRRRVERAKRRRGIRPARARRHEDDDPPAGRGDEGPPAGRGEHAQVAQRGRRSEERPGERLDARVVVGQVATRDAGEREAQGPLRHEPELGGTAEQAGGPGIVAGLMLEERVEELAAGGRVMARALAVHLRVRRGDRRRGRIARSQEQLPERRRRGRTARQLGGRRPEDPARRQRAVEDALQRLRGACGGARILGELRAARGLGIARREEREQPVDRARRGRHVVRLGSRAGDVLGHAPGEHVPLGRERRHELRVDRGGLPHPCRIRATSLPQAGLALPHRGDDDTRDGTDPWGSARSTDGPWTTSMHGQLTNDLKTWTLMAALGGLLVAVGGMLGGQTGMVMAFAFALLLNGVVYWKSDALALRANGARELGPDELPELRATVADLAQRAGMPMPRLYLVDRPEPNAFATGRSPSHAAVAVTTGLLQAMDRRQVTGVLAHELAHVKNRDTLIGTIAATIGGAVSFLAQMAQFQLLFGGGDDEEGGNPFGALVAIILAPIAALVIQLAVSRSREYQADTTGAALTGDPEGLAGALETLEAASQRQGLLGRFRRQPARAENPAFAHLWIVSPLAGVNVGSLFSTHPPIADRVARLRGMRRR